MLDKVWYVNKIDVKEVTISSKIHTNNYKEKVINVIVDDNVLEVKLYQLFYTEKEAYEDIIDIVSRRISDTEKHLEYIKHELKDLHNLYYSIECKIK